ncbi:DEAD-box ATP-dependent RNA helicase 58, chloroplastic-like isoform X2 [Camellia sinensis]|uniref:DEAD-box ATP-dependent RNA helicase 58, chloroplastic-like isoform X2 n=1 Tax=Camellia sinensis TaxID=4442 RepID=UPI001035E4DF|nr:DEAD-box ATP-dependent RNA helicase 58, chloroplastic-like isoform X2 [Camellia sinensis]
MFNSSKQVSSFRKLLISYSLRNNRQTIFASASIPQHRRFLSDCIQQKWTKDDIVHVHVNAVEPMPSRLHHRFVSEKSKKAGHAPPTTLLIELLKTSLPGCFDIIILEEDMNFNLRAALLLQVFLQK